MPAAITVHDPAALEALGAVVAPLDPREAAAAQAKAFADAALADWEAEQAAFEAEEAEIDARLAAAAAAAAPSPPPQTFAGGGRGGAGGGWALQVDVGGAGRGHGRGQRVITEAVAEVSTGEGVSTAGAAELKRSVELIDTMAQVRQPTLPPPPACAVGWLADVPRILRPWNLRPSDLRAWGSDRCPPVGSRNAGLAWCAPQSSLFTHDCVATTLNWPNPP